VADARDWAYRIDDWDVRAATEVEALALAVAVTAAEPLARRRHRTWAGEVASQARQAVTAYRNLSARREPWDGAGTAQWDLLRDIFRWPAAPAGVGLVEPSDGGQVASRLARAIYTDRAFDRLPVLADALEDAGCTDAAILAHCRSGGVHVRGCWVVDMVLGRT
jgi:hypothetical protein